MPQSKKEMSDLIIYELHVRGFTKHASSNVKYKGTFAGITEKIPYLKGSGIQKKNEFHYFLYERLKGGDYSVKFFLSSHSLHWDFLLQAVQMYTATLLRLNLHSRHKGPQGISYRTIILVFGLLCKLVGKVVKKSYFLSMRTFYCGYSVVK